MFSQACDGNIATSTQAGENQFDRFGHIVYAVGDDAEMG